MLTVDTNFANSGFHRKQLPGVPPKTGHCLISCNLKAIKAVAMKYRSLHSKRTNLDFDI